MLFICPVDKSLTGFMHGYILDKGSDVGNRYSGYCIRALARWLDSQHSQLIINFIFSILLPSFYLTDKEKWGTGAEQRTN